MIRCIERDLERLVSTVSLLECSIVMEARYGSAGVRELDAFIDAVALEPVAFDSIQARLAREAYRNFGNGRHPAGLNFGDCCTYALAQAHGAPLLFQGNDFSQTDVVTALPI